MKEKEFEAYLKNDKNIKSKDKAVATRMAKARDAEKILGYSLDIAVSTDENMYLALVKLREYDKPNHSPRQNALRKYYCFINGKEFPRIRDYEKIS